MQPTWIWQFSIFQAAKTITLSLMFFLLSPPPSLSRTPLSMSLVILLLLLSDLGMALSVWPCNQEDTKISLTIFRLDETFLFILHPSIPLSLSKNTSFYEPLTLSGHLRSLLLSGLRIALSLWPCNQDPTKISLTIFTLDKIFYLLHLFYPLHLSFFQRRLFLRAFLLSGHLRSLLLSGAAM